MVGLPKKRTKRKRKSELWGPRKKTAAQIAGDNTPDRLEINRIIATKRDYGDRELAFITLGMNSTPNADYILPNVDGFLTLVNALFARLHPTVIDLSPYPNSDKRLVAMRAGQACSRIQMAIRTIGGFQNEFWGARWDGPLIVVNMGDIRPGATWDATNPMSADDLANHVAIVLQQPTSDRYSNYRLHHHPSMDPPTTNEVIQASWNRVSKYMEDSCMRPPISKPLHISDSDEVLVQRSVAGDGNCGWYALAEAFEGAYNWVSFAQIKANIRKFVMSVLNDQRHPRYRTYCFLQAASVRRTTAYDETSFVRSLHACSLRAGISRWIPGVFERKWGNPELMATHQAFADYYNAEVFLFEDDLANWDSDDENIDPENPPPVPTIARVRGREEERQVFVYLLTNHYEGVHPPRDAIPGWKLDYPLEAEERVDIFPWHPRPRGDDELDVEDETFREHMTEDDLPTPLDWNLTFENVATRASRAEVDYVLANRNFPHLMPELPFSEDEINAWDDPIHDNPVDGPMPTIRNNPAAYGPPPHKPVLPNQFDRVYDQGRLFY